MAPGIFENRLNEGYFNSIVQSMNAASAIVTEEDTHIYWNPMCILLAWWNESWMNLPQSKQSELSLSDKSFANIFYVRDISSGF